MPNKAIGMMINTVVDETPTAILNNVRISNNGMTCIISANTTIKIQMLASAMCTAL